MLISAKVEILKINNDFKPFRSSVSLTKQMNDLNDAAVHTTSN